MVLVAPFPCGASQKMKNLEESLSNLKNGTVSVSDTNAYPEAGMASVELLFADGSKLRANYWRVIKNGRQA
jgi:hypothetical protein